MIKISAKKIGTKIQCLLPALFLAILFITIVCWPQKTYAIEPIYKVLQTETTIKTVWNSVLTLMNSLAIGVLIFIAFANILRININNYGIKKFLPTLVLAIVVANFSYLFCRLLVDISNVAMALLMEGTAGTELRNAAGQSGPPGVAGAFDFTSIKISLKDVAAADRTAVVGRGLLYALEEFVGAILIFILSFLFYIRNYIIYFLVALSPLAFVATVLPQTKSAFNMWWSQFWRWTFLPIISLFWLWVGGMWFSSGLVPNTNPAQTNSSIFSLGFAIVCYYLAITTPFKMGGGIMQQWGNLGKRVWGATGGRGVEYMKAKGTATWGARRQNVQNLVKERTGIGKGLDMAQQKLADAQKRQKLIQEEAKAGYVKRRGERRAMWELANKSKEGSLEYAEKEAISKAITSKKYRGRAEEMRQRSQKAIAEMAVFDAYWNALNDKVKTPLFQYRGVKDGKIESYAEIVNGELVPIRGKEKEFAERQKFLNMYSESFWQANLRKREAEKASGDVVKRAVEERQSYDNVQTEFRNSGKMLEALNKLVRSSERLRDLDEKERRNELNAEEKNELNQFRKDQALLESEGYRIDTAENRDKSITDLTRRREIAESNRNIANQLINETVRKTGEIPVYLSDMVVKQVDGSYKIGEPRSPLEKSRMGAYINGEIIMPGARTVNETFSAREQIATLKHGSETEGISAEAVNNFYRGERSKNSADINRKIEEFARASASKISSRNKPDSLVALAGQIDLLASRGNIRGFQEMAKAINENLKIAGLRADSDQFINESSSDIDYLRGQIEALYRGGEERIAALKRDGVTTNPQRKSWDVVVSAVLSNKELGLKGRGSDYV